MKKYYCHACSLKLGYLDSSGADLLNLTGSTYLLEKFIKHTLPPTKKGLISIFSDPTYENYKSSTVNALASGSTIVNINTNQIDVVWFSNQANGLSFLNAVPQINTDVIKTVLHHDETRIHSFPVNSVDLITKTCNDCGTNILTGSTT